MPLFQQSVLKKYLATQDSEQVKAAYTKYAAYFLNKEIQENIRNAKEEQFQQKFLMELFVNVFGYVMNPDAGFNLTTELKNIKDAKKTDGAILTTRGHDPLATDKTRGHVPLLAEPTAIAVIELKGTDTKDLDKVNDQAFNYKNNQPDCVYVITSNFEKLRFFIHNAVEHEEFNLFKLTEDRFALLWLFLQKDNLLGGIPAKIKEESLLQEDKITKALYADYSAFKNDLWNNMVQRNPQHDQLLLYKKSQKLLDRFLFIFFSEDKGLLPPNSISVIVEQWQKLKDLDEYKPLYSRFKKYFGYMNDGYKGAKYEIHAYNGGLFKADELLDGLLIDDELLKKHCLKLTNYDFADEVDTNILGHIFEHSLNDIENVRAQLAGEEVDKSKTKRKKDGVFYTPKYITKYIVDNTVGKLCEEKKAELEIDDEEFAKDRKGRKKATILKLDAQLKAYREWLLQLTICDPACGSGAFLNQALEFLMAEHRYVDELEAQLFEGSIVFPDVENHILENNIYGVDINEESVEIARLSLWLRTAQKGRKLTSLSSNIKCGNSLIDDPEVAGDLAFDWQKEFPNVFKEKDKHAYHITTATHDSRTSQRMVDHKVRQKRDNGARPYPEAIWLEPEDEIHITQTIATVVKEDGLNVLAYNICGDHMHLLLICEEEEVAAIVGKIKAVSAKEHNRRTGRTYSHTEQVEDTATRGHVPLSNTEPEEDTTTRRHVPLSNTEPEEDTTTRGHVPLSNTETETETETGKKKSIPLWTQKFGCKEITDQEQLENTIDYIQRNRAKHELPVNKTLQNHIDSMLCGYDQAYATEYKGGFDVVIGNPPYVPFRGSDGLFYQKTFSTALCGDLYTLFFEQGAKLLASNGLLGFITPSSFMTNIGFLPLRKFMLSRELILIIDHGSHVFKDASVDSATIIFQNRTVKESLIQCSGDGVLFTIISSSIFEKLEDSVFNIYINPIHLKLADKIILKSENFADHVDFARGVEFGFSSDQVLKSRIDSAHPIVCGGNIRRNRIQFEDKYLIHNSENPSIYKNDTIYVQPKILVRRIGSSITSAYDDSGYWNVCDVYNLQSNSTTPYPLMVIAAVTNSKLIDFIYTTKFRSVKNLFPKIPIQNLRKLPLPKFNVQLANKILNVFENDLSLNKNHEILLSSFTHHLQSKFDLPKPSTKLQQWPSLDFKGFLAELKKTKVVLGLEEEAEWMAYFNKKKAEANALQSEIDRIDKAIDQMVYELYGLSEEEIGIVENT